LNWLTAEPTSMAPGPRADGDPSRQRIVSFLERNQGAHLSAIVRALMLGNHQATIHLKTLEAAASVWGRKEGVFLRYYTASIPTNTPAEQLPNPQVIYTPDTMQFRILDRLARNPPGTSSTGPLTQGQLAEELGCSQQLVSHHLISLEGGGCVSTKRSGFRKQWRVLAPGLQAITGGLQSLSTLDHHDLDALIKHYS
jgi:predicted transcriptional regulator